MAFAWLCVVDDLPHAFQDAFLGLDLALPCHDPLQQGPVPAAGQQLKVRHPGGHEEAQATGARRL